MNQEKYSEDTVKTLEERVAKLTRENQELKLVIKRKDEYIVQTQKLAEHYATGKLMQVNHFFFRLKAQLFKGNKEERQEFWGWIKGRIRRTNRTIGEGKKYNPWMVIHGKLQEALSCTNELNQRKASNAAFSDRAEVHMLVKKPDEDICKILSEKYQNFDVIFLAVIDYDFRHQRPQHFATRFAENGYRVFYVNANFVRPDSVKEIADGLYVVDFSNQEHNAVYTMQGQDTLPWMQEKLGNLIYDYAIRDAVVVVDYPNWVYAAEHLRERYGFSVVTDYMDDFTGFLGTAEDFLKDNCVRLLQSSDLVIASSQFLLEVARKYAAPEKICVIRNGTEVEHFYRAVNLPNTYGDRKVVGYYGAVAHWFAWEKVCFLAKNLPECDIVIIGEVTEHRDKLEQYSNIKILGEKKYTELPEHLTYFDVCLIPFDTSTDLIKATNPVKFYEYLSAGKKVVATEIPELMPYRDDYVYMSNDDEEFLAYVKQCLEGTDTLKGKEECIAFARENDWQKRFEKFAEAAGNMVPKVSIIMLTYNNLELNKACINSILNNTAYASYELIVIDNLSTDGTREYLTELDAKGYANVKIILNEENSGFAGGNNLGIREATGDYVLLLNNDTVVTRGWLTNLVKHLEQNEKFGMCGPVTNSIGNEAQIRVDYRGEQEMQQFAYAYTWEHMEETYTDIDRLAMFCTIIRKEVVEKCGGLDEQYKIGMFEDDDYAQAVCQAGYEIGVAEDVFIHHVNNASFKKLDDATYRKIFDENKARYERKWNVKWKMPKYREGVTGDCNNGMEIK